MSQNRNNNERMWGHFFLGHVFGETVCLNILLLITFIRPPGTVVPDGLMFYP